MYDGDADNALVSNEDDYPAILAAGNKTSWVFKLTQTWQSATNIGVHPTPIQTCAKRRVVPTTWLGAITGNYTEPEEGASIRRTPADAAAAAADKAT